MDDKGMTSFQNAVITRRMCAPPGGRSDPSGSTHAVPNGHPPPPQPSAMAPPSSARAPGAPARAAVASA